MPRAPKSGRPVAFIAATARPSLLAPVTARSGHFAYVTAARCVGHGYGFAKSQGKPTFDGSENISGISGVANGLAVCATSRLHVVQCDT
jgi:hypothetical protein